MARYSDDDDETPAQVWLQLQRQKAAERNFVTPAPLATRQPTTIDAPSWLAEQSPMPLETAWTALQGAKESTNAMDRARALRVRLTPFLLAWGAVAVVVGGAVWLVAGSAPGAAMLGALCFALLTAGTYVKMNTTDYEYSREGTERYKVTTAADLAKIKMHHDQELKRMALETYLRQLEGRDR